jgi:ATP-dependent HslUV protease ATP-binding subunit HslU
MKKMLNLTPKEIVSELDRFIIGQSDAKKAVAIALRNRQRRRQIDKSMRDEIMPHNILMVGPTGVGKTEISRRLAKLTSSPFIKVEATKFTEVGYVGRDVDSIIRDLLDVAILHLREDMRKNVVAQASIIAEERLLGYLVGENTSDETKEKFRYKFRAGQLDEQEVTIELIDNSNNLMQGMDVPGAQIGLFNIGDMIGKALGSKKTKKVTLKVSDAFQSLVHEESDKILNEEQIIKSAINSVENDGIVFLDEIDKIASKGNTGGRGEVSREGVQRDLLPLIEGTTVSTKYGPVKTNHILFIASGAFHIAKPSDLLPELQGRLPIQVHLKPLTEEDLLRILIEREYNLPRQYTALLAVDGIDLTFSDEALKKIANIASEMNDKVENIGARRLQAILEKVVEEISFNGQQGNVTIDEQYVIKQLENTINPILDMRKFIL